MGEEGSVGVGVGDGEEGADGLMGSEKFSES